MSIGEMKDTFVDPRSKEKAFLFLFPLKRKNAKVKK